MGWLNTPDEGRQAPTCRHGVELKNFCRRCSYPSAEEVAQDEQERLARGKEFVARQEAERIAEASEAEERAASDAAHLASLTPYYLAVWEARWEDAYALLPDPCYLHEQSSDGYPPPAKRVQKPTFTKFYEVENSGWRDYRETK